MFGWGMISHQAERYYIVSKWLDLFTGIDQNIFYNSVFRLITLLIFKKMHSQTNVSIGLLLKYFCEVLKPIKCYVAENTLGKDALNINYASFSSIRVNIYLKHDESGTWGGNISQNRA